VSEKSNRGFDAAPPLETSMSTAEKAAGADETHDMEHLVDMNALERRIATEPAGHWIALGCVFSVPVSESSTALFGSFCDWSSAH
jgi:hypothetical protein